MDALLYVHGKGWLYRVDPRIKLLFALSFSVYLVWKNTVLGMALTLLALHLLCLLVASTHARILGLWKAIYPLLLFILILGSLRWQAPSPLCALGPLTVTRESFWRAARLAMRVAGLTFTSSLVLWTTEPSAMVTGLARLGVPFELGFPAVMALQFVIMFRHMFDQILQAQQSRGLTLPRYNPIRVARAYIPVLIPLLINALRLVDTLALALQARGFGAPARRTWRRQLHIRWFDWLFLVCTWGVLLGISQV